MLRELPQNMIEGESEEQRYLFETQRAAWEAEQKQEADQQQPEQEEEEEPEQDPHDLLCQNCLAELDQCMSEDCTETWHHPGKELCSNCQQEQAEPQQTEEPVQAGHELIRSISIENLLSQRNGILERYQQIKALAKEIEQLTSQIKVSSAPDFRWYHRGTHEDILNSYRPECTKAEDGYRKAIDACAWEYLMKESGNLALMDQKAREEWHKSLEKDVPELTASNIKATFQSLHESREDLFNRGIINIFKGLSWDYKTNSPFKLTKKIILTYMTGYSSHHADQLSDLYRAFHVLDGKPVPEYRDGITNQLSNARHNGLQPIDTDYLSIKLYRNGNGHVTFKRMDLVEQMNKIVARHFPFHIPQDNKQR